VFLALAWLYLTRVADPVASIRAPAETRDERRAALHAIGPMSRGEWGVLIVFLFTVAGWTLREPIARLLPAAADLLTKRIDDAAVAIIAGVALFAIPSGDRERPRLLDWATASRLPWEVLLLFGGGLALAAGVQASGLDRLAADAMGAAVAWPSWALLLTVVVAAVFLSEITSNTAQASLFLPLLAGIAAASGTDPLALLVPCVIALSCAFMMPMGTPPNAIVFSSGRLTIRQMAWRGLGLNWLGIALVMLLAYSLVPRVLIGTPAASP
jgi:sodium-dependent dicarboxylate transporter 2/3/5